MKLELSARAEQKLLLTQEMKQSLETLQMPIQDLRDYINEAALENPLMELDAPPQEDVPEQAVIITPQKAEIADDENWDAPARSEVVFAESLNTPGFVSANSDPDSEGSIFDTVLQQGESFTEQLHEQIACMRRLDATTAAVCDYLIDCLNEKGYLDFELQELASECEVTLFEAEQALYVVQSLEPAGTGARSLSECLVLQLSRGSNFNAVTLHMVTEGLPLLAKKDYAGLAELLHCTQKQAMEAADVVRRLNPIPSRGFGKSGSTPYLVPEAEIIADKNGITVEMNRSFLPVIRINEETRTLLSQSGEESNLKYLRENEKKAEQLTQSVEKRCSTMQRLLEQIVVRQKAFFLEGAPLQAMTMSELAEALEMNVSTVSRAVSGKCVRFNGGTLLLKDLFVSAVSTGAGAVSSDGIKRSIEMFVHSEDKAHPLSDEELRLALEAIHIQISRRTITKYRQELGIPSSTDRKRKA